MRSITDASSYFDEYLLTRRIGTGYSADVFEGEKDGRTYALKIFKDEAKDFAENEFERGSQLRHPLILDY